MSTHAAIIMQSGDRYRGVYCHSDGYVAGVGYMLHTHYADPAKVEALIALGELSILGPTFHEPNPFDGRDSNKTCAYHRDRGEPLYISEGKTWREVADQIGHSGYAYVFTDGKWFYSDAGAYGVPLPDLKLLADVLRAKVANTPLPVSIP